MAAVLGPERVQVSLLSQVGGELGNGDAQVQALRQVPLWAVVLQQVSQDILAQRTDLHTLHATWAREGRVLFQPLIMVTGDDSHLARMRIGSIQEAVQDGMLELGPISHLVQLLDDKVELLIWIDDLITGSDHTHEGIRVIQHGHGSYQDLGARQAIDDASLGSTWLTYQQDSRQLVDEFRIVHIVADGVEDTESRTTVGQRETHASLEAGALEQSIDKKNYSKPWEFITGSQMQDLLYCGLYQIS